MTVGSEDVGAQGTFERSAAAEREAKFGYLGLTYDDVLLLPNESNLIPSAVETSITTDSKHHTCRPADF